VQFAARPVVVSLNLNLSCVQPGEGHFLNLIIVRVVPGYSKTWKLNDQLTVMAFRRSKRRRRANRDFEVLLKEGDEVAPAF
jgi:hypothetical protein